MTRTKDSWPGRSDPPAPYRYEEGTLTLNLHVQPGASRTSWAGLHGDSALKLRLAAPALEGRANEACIRFLAQAAGVPRSAIEILRGEHTRDKTLRISSVSTVRLEQLVKAWQKK
ncbi:MAG: DUF167 domain-containing protein [Deltaproteobacteria bacterium]|nr:DUF167 domain-containing protein [Deltaproteobacteria bacterium]